MSVYEHVFFSTDLFALRASRIPFGVEVCLILHEQRANRRFIFGSKKTTFKYITQYLSRTMYKILRLKM